MMEAYILLYTIINKLLTEEKMNPSAIEGDLVVFDHYHDWQRIETGKKHALEELKKDQTYTVKKISVGSYLDTTQLVLAEFPWTWFNADLFSDAEDSWKEGECQLTQ